MAFKKLSPEKINKEFLDACKKANRAKMLEMLEAGANINATDKDGMTGLMLAIERHDENGGGAVIAGILVEKGADSNVRLPDGTTALHIVARRGNFSAAKLLVESGADITILDNSGYDAVMIAEGWGRQGVLNFLRGETGAEGQKTVASADWVQTAPLEVSYVSEKEGIGYRLTDIFNFTDRMHTRITHNVATGTESHTTRFFGEFTDKTMLRRAKGALEQATGEIIDEAVIDSAVIPKLSAPKPD